MLQKDMDRCVVIVRFDRLVRIDDGTALRIAVRGAIADDCADRLPVRQR